MFFYTDIYEEVQANIVETLCLSCIKLKTKTSTDFIFDTATGQPHSDFVVEDLKNIGPVFLHYSEKACPACDIMYPIIKDFFDIDFQKDKSYETLVTYKNTTISYIYIYLDDSSTPDDRVESFDIYDKDFVQGLPMFSFITLEYHHGGDIKPFYTTLYGAFNSNTEERVYTLTNLMDETIDLYDRNKGGFE